MKKFDAIGFDLDGTLWSSIDAVKYSWQEASKLHSDVTHPPTEEEIRGVMGLGPRDIAIKLFPYLSEERAVEIFAGCTKIEIEHVRRVGGVLYDGLEETLKTLSQHYPLFIVSNCQCGYIEAFFEYHGLQKYFTDYENAERTGLTKGENIKLVMHRNGFASCVYIGDTAGDQKGAGAAGAQFIFANYGFGKADAPEYEISSLKELPGLLLGE